MKQILFTIIFVLWASIVLATTYHVGPGQTYTTFAAFHAAVTPSPGDIVDGGGNTFTEEVIPNCSGSASGGWITYQNFKVNGAGQAIDNGIITYDSGSGGHHTYLKFVNIEVYNINNPGGNDDSGIYLTAENYSDEAHNQVINCIIHDIDLDYLSAGIRPKGRHNRIEGCIIYNIGGDAIYAGGAHFTMVGCKIYNIGTDYSVHAADCIQCSSDCTDVYIAHNTLTTYNGHKNNKQCIIVSTDGSENSGIIEYNDLTGYVGGNETVSCKIMYLYGNFIVRYNTLKNGWDGIWLTQTGNSEVYYNYIHNINDAGINSAFTTNNKIYNNTITDIVGYSGMTPAGCIDIGDNSTAEIKNNICENSSTYGLKYWGTGGVTADYNSFYNCASGNYADSDELEGVHDKHQTSSQFNSSGLLIAGSNLIGAGETQSIHGSAPDWIVDYNRRPVVKLPPDIGMATYSPVPVLKQGSSILEASQ